ncbi:MAG: hypothetical protein K1Y02_21935 [Candidatus Hydrogenedentes bacterium]|nr:hypothetical protein [Candidatus Hydrogenedentota bacterium]
MAFPILEGLQLVNGVRSLWHEIKSGRDTAKTNALNASNSMSSANFAALLAAQLKANANTASMAKSFNVQDRPLQTALSTMSDNFQAKLTQFREALGNIFSNAGITGLNELDLTTDSNGHVVVASDHPQKDRIEALFEAHPALELMFQRLSAQASLTRTALDQFPLGGYLLDPQGAVQNYGQLLSGTNSPQQFHLVIGPNGISTYFGEQESTGTGTAKIV